MAGYLPIQLCIYIPMCLYGYIAIRLCVYNVHPWGCFFCLVTGFPMRWMFPYVGVFVWGGDGALAHTRVVAPGCAGDGVSRAGKFHPHPARLHALTGYMCRPVSLAKVRVRRHRRVGFLFVCLFGVSPLCPVFSSKVASRLFLPFWFAHAGARVGQWGV